MKVTTLDQRFGQIEFQPDQFSDIYPTHKHLMIKRSQRCRRYDQALSEMQKV